MTPDPTLQAQARLRDMSNRLDGDEVKRYHTDPLVANALPPQAPPTQAPPTPKDSDGDGLSDDDEKNVYRTDPNRKDTDRDGREDGSEVKNGTNPRIPFI